MQIFRKAKKSNKLNIDLCQSLDDNTFSIAFCNGSIYYEFFKLFYLNDLHAWMFRVALKSTIFQRQLEIFHTVFPTYCNCKWWIELSKVKTISFTICWFFCSMVMHLTGRLVHRLIIKNTSLHHASLASYNVSFDDFWQSVGLVSWFCVLSFC